MNSPEAKAEMQGLWRTTEMVKEEGLEVETKWNGVGEKREIR